MQWLDLFLLDRLYQPICDVLYDWIGDCIVITRSLIRLAIGFTIFCIIWRVVELRIYASDLLMATFLISQLALMGALIYSHRLARHMLNFTGFNPLRVLLAMPRLMLIITYGIVWMFTIMIFDVDVVGNSLWFIRDVSTLSAVYCASCQTRPPMRRYRQPRVLPA